MFIDATPNSDSEVDESQLLITAKSFHQWPWLVTYLVDLIGACSLNPPFNLVTSMSDRWLKLAGSP